MYSLSYYIFLNLRSKCCSPHRQVQCNSRVRVESKIIQAQFTEIYNPQVLMKASAIVDCSHHPCRGSLSYCLWAGVSGFLQEGLRDLGHPLFQ